MESQFERLLREKLALMIDMKIQAMTVTGLASFDEYRHSLGYIEALRQTLAAMDETQTDMRKD